MADAEVATQGGSFGPSRHVTVSQKEPRQPSAGSGGRRTGSGGRRGTPGDPDGRQVPSAHARWKRQHEQSMMEKLVGLRNEKKEFSKISRSQAQNIARKIPVEILAKEWLNMTEATLEVRAYLVEKVLPTLILGVEKLLNEADKKGLVENGERNDNFNPINFLAQYLMRNNPRYSNFSEASPYVRGLREVADELKRELFNLEDNRLARIKAEARRRREEREKIEMLRQQERERREKMFVDQFSEWTANPDGRVELSLMQNTLRSFIELSDRYPDHLREAAKLSHPIEPTDESGKAMTVKEFAQYMTSYVEDLPRELFDQFMVHMSKCSMAHRATAARENRRIRLTNLFISCDHSGIGLLDRHRILSLFETFWDMAKPEIRVNLRNPRKWPVVEVDEADDDISDEEEVVEKPPEEQGPKPTDNKVQEETTQQEKAEEQVEEKKEEVQENAEEEGEKVQAEQEEKKEEGKQPEVTEQGEATQQEETSVTEQPEKPPEQQEEQAEEKKDAQVEEKKAEEKKEEQTEQTETEEKKDEEKTEQAEAKEEEKAEEQVPEPEKPAETTDEQKPAEEAEVTEEKKEEQAATQKEATQEAMVEGGTSTEGMAQEMAPLSAKEQTAQGEEEKDKDDLEKEVDLSGELGDKGVPKTPGTDLHPASVSFAEGTEFERGKTAMTTMSRSHSQASAFDESALNVSQFVQLTETFLGDEPQNFDGLMKYVKEGYQETEDEKMERLVKARKEALSFRRKQMLDNLFDSWDNDGSGYLDQDEVENVMQKYKDGQENEAIEKAKAEMKKKSKHPQDNRLSKREFRQFVTMVAEGMPGADAFDYLVEFLGSSVEQAFDTTTRSYAERIRGEARKKWLQQIITAAETGGANMEPVYRAIFQALYKDAEAHGGSKHISAYISMLERNISNPSRGDVCLRYVAATTEDADFLLGKILYKDMPGISFPAVESGKPIHVPRVANHGNIQFWNPYRNPDEREGSFIVVPLKDRKKRVFGLLGVDTLYDRHTKSIFITHEIQYYQGIAKSFSISYHHVDMRNKLLRITESAVSWIHRRSPHVKEIVAYMVEPDDKGLDFVLRKMLVTDKKGNVQSLTSPPRLERKDNLFRDYLFKCVDNSESVSADAYGERHLAFPLRDDQGRAVAVLDISIGETKQLPSHENREVQRMLRLLQIAHKEITKEMNGEDKTMVLEAEKDDETRMDIMFDRLMLMELRENVSKVDAKAFAELRSYNDPPKIVLDILKAVMSIFETEQVEQGEFDDWNTMKSHVNQDLLRKIATYDPTATDGQELIAPEKIERYLTDVPHGEVAKHSSVPSQYMYNWVFVCLSLIEHTMKMRKNNQDSAIPGPEDEVQGQVTAEEQGPATQAAE